MDLGHDEARTLEFRNIRVTITLRSEEYAAEAGLDPNTVLVFIDTPELPAETPLSIKINDFQLFEGTPGHGPEGVDHNQYDGFFIVQGANA